MGFRIFGWEARESPTEKVTFDLKEVKRTINLSRENRKCKGPEEGAC